MLTITVTGDFEHAKLEKIREKEIEQYARAIAQNSKNIGKSFDFAIRPMLVKKGFDVAEIEKCIERFGKAYEFDAEVLENGMKFWWRGHYWLDYDNEQLVAVLYKTFSMMKPFWWLPNILRDKLSAIRDPRKFFLPKLDEPKVYELYTKYLVGQIEMDFRKMDKDCKVEWRFEEENESKMQPQV